MLAIGVQMITLIAIHRVLLSKIVAHSVGSNWTILFREIQTCWVSVSNRMIPWERYFNSQNLISMAQIRVKRRYQEIWVQMLWLRPNRMHTFPTSLFRKISCWWVRTTSKQIQLPAWKISVDTPDWLQIIWIILVMLRAPSSTSRHFWVSKILTQLKLRSTESRPDTIRLWNHAILKRDLRNNWTPNLSMKMARISLTMHNQINEQILKVNYYEKIR